MHAGASAKVLLAFLKPSEIETALSAAPFPRYTERTVTNLQMLRSQLKDIRAAGYVVADGEVDVGVRGIAAPILDANEQVVASSGIAGPEFRLNNHVLPSVITAVQEAARVISQKLCELDM